MPSLFSCVSNEKKNVEIKCKKNKQCSSNKTLSNLFLQIFDLRIVRYIQTYKVRSSTFSITLLC